MLKPSLFLLLLMISSVAANAQELQARVTVNASRVPTTVDKKIFTTLQTQLTNFLNNRKWTSDVFQAQEKIECNFFLNVEGTEETNVYKAAMTIQAARPVYNSGYNTAIMNFQDGDITFRYVEYQPVEFNENRVQGSDPLAGNLTAVFAYYVYTILGLDYNSFGPKGGDVYFQKAQNIVNNAPESRGINGWKAFDGQRNRYWLMENLLNTRYNLVHDVMYTYYRQGLDNMYSNESGAREQILQALTQLQTVNAENPNIMFIQFFMQGKSDELIRIFRKSPPQEKSRAADLLQKLDVSNASKYKQELK